MEKQENVVEMVGGIMIVVVVLDNWQIKQKVRRCRVLKENKLTMWLLLIVNDRGTVAENTAKEERKQARKKKK